MSYSVTLSCGCDVYVACHPITAIAHTRVIERRGPRCPVRKHDVGTRIWLWELLPGGLHDDRDPKQRVQPGGAAADGRSRFGLKL